MSSISNLVHSNCLKYACQKNVPNLRTDALPGSAIVVQKGPDDCNNPGPVTAGFNQAACGTFCKEYGISVFDRFAHSHNQSSLLDTTDTFYGQWCPNPRNCTDLALCIQDEILEIEADDKRPAFLQYLKDAPTVDVFEGESTDPTKCGDLREYFEYDRDYPDDERICEEVKDLKVSKDRVSNEPYSSLNYIPMSSSDMPFNLNPIIVPYRFFKLGWTCYWSSWGQ